MPWNPSPEVAVARDAAKKFGADECIVIYIRYVGAQIGIHSPAGERVGEVSHLRNVEYMLVAGDPARVRRMVEPFAGSPALNET